MKIYKVIITKEVELDEKLHDSNFDVNLPGQVVRLMTKDLQSFLTLANIKVEECL